MVVEQNLFFSGSEEEAELYSHDKPTSKNGCHFFREQTWNCT